MLGEDTLGHSAGGSVYPQVSDHVERASWTSVTGGREALLDEACVVEDQDCARLAETFRDELPYLARKFVAGSHDEDADERWIPSGVVRPAYSAGRHPFSRQTGPDRTRQDPHAPAGVQSGAGIGGRGVADVCGGAVDAGRVPSAGVMPVAATEVGGATVGAVPSRPDRRALPRGPDPAKAGVGGLRGSGLRGHGAVHQPDATSVHPWFRAGSLRMSSSTTYPISESVPDAASVGNTGVGTVGCPIRQRPASEASGTARTTAPSKRRPAR